MSVQFVPVAIAHYLKLYPLTDNSSLKLTCSSFIYFHLPNICEEGNCVNIYMYEYDPATVYVLSVTFDTEGISF